MSFFRTDNGLPRNPVRFTPLPKPPEEHWLSTRALSTIIVALTGAFISLCALLLYKVAQYAVANKWMSRLVQIGREEGIIPIQLADILSSQDEVTLLIGVLITLGVLGELFALTDLRTPFFPKWVRRLFLLIGLFGLLQVESLKHLATTAEPTVLVAWAFVFAIFMVIGISLFGMRSSND